VNTPKPKRTSSKPAITRKTTISISFLLGFGWRIPQPSKG
jgi:hypothetical protein